MSLLHKVDYYLMKVMTFLSGLLILSMTVIVCLQVFIRYVLKASLGMLSDLPPYFLVFVVWISSVIAVRNDDHIRIELLDGIIKNKEVVKWINAAIKGIMTVAMAIFAYHCCIYVANAFAQGTSDPALKIPYWVLYSILPITSVLMTIYYGVNTIKQIKGGKDE